MKASEKQKLRLKRRQEAYEKSITAKGSKIDPSGYHKPGSMNRKKAFPAGTR